MNLRGMCLQKTGLPSTTGLNTLSMLTAMFRNDDVELEQMLLVLEEEFLPYDAASLWQVANAVLRQG